MAKAKSMKDNVVDYFGEIKCYEEKEQFDRDCKYDKEEDIFWI